LGLGEIGLGLGHFGSGLLQSTLGEDMSCLGLREACLYQSGSLCRQRGSGLLIGSLLEAVVSSALQALHLLLEIFLLHLEDEDLLAEHSLGFDRVLLALQLALFDLQHPSLGLSQTPLGFQGALFEDLDLFLCTALLGLGLFSLQDRL
jgi:hypothetical protein